MAEEKKYAKGLRIFPPREGSPDFVIGKVLITPREFITFMASMAEHFTEYNGQQQLKFDLLKGNSGMYMVVDTYKPQKTNSQQSETTAQQVDDLPF